MSNITVTVPDIGGAEDVEIIEISVAVGDSVEAEQDLLVLESDKASMEVPSPQSGKISKILVSVGDKVSEGSPIFEMETDAAGDAPAEEAKAETEAPKAEAAAPAAEEKPAAEPAGEQIIELTIPDLGGADEVTVIEISVNPEDSVEADDALIVLESDKASMDVPSPQAGVVKEIMVKVDDKVKEGDVYAKILVSGAAAPAPAKAEEKAPAADKPAASAPAAKPAAAEKPAAESKTQTLNETTDEKDIHNVYAGPSSRRLARQLGVNLTKVKGTGMRGRITKDDIREYVKAVLKQADSGAVGVTAGAGIPPVPAVDFSQFGEIELVKMSKVKKLTAVNMSRAWLNVPHVTQFDEADITDLDEFRKSMKAEAEKQGVKLTPLPFMIKAAAASLVAEPGFNVSLHHDGEHIVQKNYVHIGIACDTPNGLMVPVLRDADKKGIYQIAKEVNELIDKARSGKLKPNEMQGGCFTISSLGAIGGTGFTPIVNTPEVAIMGVSKAQIKPVWNGKEFVPRNMLPLTVSYDHRAINGADCGRFFTHFVALMSDVRRLVL